MASSRARRRAPSRSGTDRVRCLRLAATLTAVCLLAISCVQQPKRPLRVALPFWPAYELAYLARDLGYYDARRVELIDTRPPLDSQRAYRHGIVDLAPMPLDEVVTLASHDPGERIVLVIDFSLGGDAVVAHADVTRAADLKGRRIAVEPTALGALMLARVLAQAHLTRDDVTVLLIDFEDQLEAFHTRRADAVITYEPLRSALLDRGARELFSSAQIPEEVADVLVAPAALVEERAADVGHVVDGWLRALEYFERQREDAARRIATRPGVTPVPRSAVQVLASLDGLRLVGRDQNARLLGDPQERLARAAVRVASALLDVRVVTAMPDVASLFDGRFVKGAP